MYSSLKTSSILQGFPKYRSNLVGNTAYNPAGFESIATVTATGGETYLTFSSIPQGYASLQIRGIGKDSNTDFDSGGAVVIQFNSDAGSNYAYHYFSGNSDGTITVVGRANQTFLLANLSELYSNANNANKYGAMIADIHDYASTSNYKTLRVFGGAENNDTSVEHGVSFSSGLWRSTSAITAIRMKSQTTWAAGSVYALYGIKGAA